MRKSLMSISHMVREMDYPGILPAQLKPFHTYLRDCGHSLMCIPKQFVKAISSGRAYMYEVPIPVKYVMEKGFELIDGYLVVDVSYDRMLGVIVEESYDEY